MIEDYYYDEFMKKGLSSNLCKFFYIFLEREGAALLLKAFPPVRFHRTTITDAGHAL